MIDQHDLRHRRRATLRRLFAFLGVDEEFWSVSFERELNTREDKYTLTPLGRVSMVDASTQLVAG